MAQDPPQPGRVQPPGRLHQHRLGLGGQVVGELLGAVGQHLGMGRRELPVGQGLGGRGQGATEQGPGGPHRAGWPRPHPSAAGSRSQLAVEPAWMPCSAPAAPRASTAASSPSHWPSRRSSQPAAGPCTRSARARVGQPVEVLGGQLLELGHQRRQPRRLAGRMCVRVHGGNLSTPHQNTSTCTDLWISDFPRVHQTKHRSGLGRRTCPPSRGQPSCQATVWGPMAPRPDPPCHPTAQGPTARTGGIRLITNQGVAEWWAWWARR